MAKERSAYWDNIKGILMLLTVFAHCLYQHQTASLAIDHITDFIYMFHMPAFVFISGYFGKSERAQSKESILRLVFLYFIFNSAVGFLYGFTSLLKPMLSYWYLLALIAWRLTAKHLAKFRFTLPILFVLAIGAGFFETIDNNFAVSRIIGFYPYYMLGYLLPTIKTEQLRQTKYSARAVCGIALLICMLFAASFCGKVFQYTDQALIMHFYTAPLDALGRICLFGIAALGILTLAVLSPNRKIPLLSAFGRNSLWIFLFHRPFTLILSSNMQNLQNAPKILLSIGCTFVLCLLFGSDLLAKPMNDFAKDGVQFFSGNTTKKLSAAKIAVLGIAVCFIILMIRSAIALAD